MGTLRPLRTNLSQHRRRKQLSLDGSVAGVQYDRYQRGHRPALAPVENRAPGAASQGYMLSHPDAYEPHPGEVVSSDALYSPYHIEAARCAPDELDAPAASLQPDAGLAEHGGPPIDHDLAGWLMRRFVNDLSNRPSPDAIPIDHDVMFEGSIGPTLDQPVGPPGNGAAINEIWDRVCDRPTYDASRMTDATFAEAMQDAAHAASAFESVPVEGGMIDPGWFPTFEDQIAARDDGMAPHARGGAYQDIDSLGMAGDIIFEPGIRADLAATEAQDPGLPDADPFESSLGVQDVGPLEPIVEELAPQGLEPDPMQYDPMMQDQMQLAEQGPAFPGSAAGELPDQPEPQLEQVVEDEMQQLMAPWMMPGMGPMPPGLGPMGPMM